MTSKKLTDEDGAAFAQAVNELTELMAEEALPGIWDLYLHYHNTGWRAEMGSGRTLADIDDPNAPWHKTPADAVRAALDQQRAEFEAERKARRSAVTKKREARKRLRR